MKEMNGVVLFVIIFTVVLHGCAGLKPNVPIVEGDGYRIYESESMFKYSYRCSRCGATVSPGADKCPNCGGKFINNFSDSSKIYSVSLTTKDPKKIADLIRNNVYTGGMDMDLFCHNVAMHIHDYEVLQALGNDMAHSGRDVSCLKYAWQNINKYRRTRQASKSPPRIEFVNVPGGCFQMGDIFGDGEPFEKPVHEVCVSDFAIGKYEVTQGQWRKVMGNNPSQFFTCGDECPVEGVTRYDVQRFIETLNKLTGGHYRLPTEAEWEYAARSGGKNEKWAGTSSESSLGDYAWYKDNAENKTHVVGQKKPNGLGIYDMSGNVAELVGDMAGKYPSSRQQDPTGPAIPGPDISGRRRDLSGHNSRMYRGGIYSQSASGMFGIRTVERYGEESETSNGRGFRLVNPSKW